MVREQSHTYPNGVQALLTRLLWIRGLPAPILLRLAGARRAFTPAAALILTVTLASIGATVSYAYWRAPATMLSGGSPLL